MNRKIFKASPFSILRAALASIFFTLIIIAMTIYGLGETERSSRAEGLRILEEGVRRAIVTCYAVEGSYPSSVSYMEEHYGLRVDKTKYAVHYEIFASNLLPEITVIELMQ